MSALKPRTALGVRETQLVPSMTPMVDVVLVILIFFMAATVIGGREWLLDTSRAAEPSAAAGLPEPVFRVNVRGDGLVDGFGAVGVEPSALLAVVTAAIEGVDPASVEAVVVPADDAGYEDVVTVMAQLRGAGLTGVGLR